MHQYKEVEHAFINTLVRGDVSSLTWVESPNQFFESTTQSTRTSLELCHVYYSAINFRDVMLAYGRLPPDAIPGQVHRFHCHWELCGERGSFPFLLDSRWFMALNLKRLIESATM